MKKFTILTLLIAVLALPGAGIAASVEFSVGAWYVDPDGDLSYTPGPAGDIDLTNRIAYDDQWQPAFRLKTKFPLLPNIYLQATPLGFDANRDGDAFEFSVGDAVFFGNEDLDSEFFLNLYDATLFFRVPLVESGDRSIASFELGAGARWLVLKAEFDDLDIDGDVADFDAIDDSRSETVVYPMGYAGLDIEPTEYVSLTAEAWGYSYHSDKLYSLVGRLKVSPLGPLFLSGGYRYDFYDFDRSDLELDDVTFEGPFAEIGLEF